MKRIDLLEYQEVSKDLLPRWVEMDMEEEEATTEVVAEAVVEEATAKEMIEPSLPQANIRK